MAASTSLAQQSEEAEAAHQVVAAAWAVLLALAEAPALPFWRTTPPSPLRHARCSRLTPATVAMEHQVRRGNSEAGAASGTAPLRALAEVVVKEAPVVPVEVARAASPPALSGRAPSRPSREEHRPSAPPAPPAKTGTAPQRRHPAPQRPWWHSNDRARRLPRGARNPGHQLPCPARPRRGRPRLRLPGPAHGAR